MRRGRVSLGRTLTGMPVAQRSTILYRASISPATGAFRAIFGAGVASGSSRRSSLRTILRMVAPQAFFLYRETLAADRVSAPPSSSAFLDGSFHWTIEIKITGRAIIANNPHRGIIRPRVQRLGGLDAPGIHFIGANAPKIHRISLGYNQSIASRCGTLNLYSRS